MTTKSVRNMEDREIQIVLQNRIVETKCVGEKKIQKEKVSFFFRNQFQCKSALPDGPLGSIVPNQSILASAPIDPLNISFLVAPLNKHQVLSVLILRTSTHNTVLFVFFSSHLRLVLSKA